MLPIYQNHYGEREFHKGNKYSKSAYMQFLHGALQLIRTNYSVAVVTVLCRTLQNVHQLYVNHWS